MMTKSEAQMMMFLLMADEFYILTRYSALAFFQYATFRMAHHALEYYLKAGLSLQSSLNDLKKLGHNLEALWHEYQRRVPELDIDSRVIRHLNSFETMRYPGKSKFVRAAWGISYEELFSEVFKNVPEDVRQTLACFSLRDFDKLVFDLRSSLPSGKDLPMIAASQDQQKYLFQDNSCFSKAKNDKKFISASTRLGDACLRAANDAHVREIHKSENIELIVATGGHSNETDGNRRYGQAVCEQNVGSSGGT